MTKLTTKLAVLKVLNDNPRLSKYEFAGNLGVNPIMIDNYIKEVKPSRMKGTTADKMLSVYGIEITDIYNARRIKE